MSFYDDADFDNAEPSSGNKYVKQGTYKVRIKACKEVSRTRKSPFPAFFAELSVLESDNPEYPPGSSMTYWVSVKPDTPSLGNIKRFIATCFAEPVSEIKKPIAAAVVSPANPLGGTILGLIAVDRDKEKSEGKFTDCEWTLIEMSETVKQTKQAA